MAHKSKDKCNCYDDPKSCTCDTTSNSGSSSSSQNIIKNPSPSSSTPTAMSDANTSISSNMTAGTVLEDVVKSIQDVLPNVISNIAGVVGYRCEIWYPFGTSSVYGKNSNKIRYTIEPQAQSNFIGANLFTEAPMGVLDGSEFSTFVGEEPYLMTFGYKIPENSKVLIHYGTSKRWMKVRWHRAVDGSGNYLAIFNILSPLTSNGTEIKDKPAPKKDSTLVKDPKNKKIAGQNMI